MEDIFIKACEKNNTYVATEILRYNIIDIHKNRDIAIEHAFTFRNIELIKLLFDYSDITNNKYEDYILESILGDFLNKGRMFFVELDILKCVQNYCIKHNYNISFNGAIHLELYDEFEFNKYIIYLYKHGKLINNIFYHIDFEMLPLGCITTKITKTTPFKYIWDNNIITNGMYWGNMIKLNYVLFVSNVYISIVQRV